MKLRLTKRVQRSGQGAPASGSVQHNGFARSELRSLSSAELFLLSPASIVSFFGLLGLLVNLTFYSSWGTAHTLYLTGLISFVATHIGTTTALGNPARRSSHWLRNRKTTSSGFRIAYWAAAITGLLLTLFYIRDVGLRGEGNLFYNLRFQRTQENSAPPLLGYLSLFSFSLALYYAYYAKFRLMAIATSISLLGSLAYAERTSILMNLSAIAYVMSWIDGLRIKLIFIIVGVFLGLSIAIAISAGKLGGTGSEYFLFTYVGYGITAFQSWIEGHRAPRCYGLVFGSIGEFFSSPTSLAMCQNLPGATRGEFNVYTYMSPPYLVFGATGIIISMAVLGFFYAILFRMAVKARGFFLLLLSILIYPLVMVFYYWQFSLTTYYYMFILVLLLFVKLKPVAPNSSALQPALHRLPRE